MSEEVSLGLAIGVLAVLGAIVLFYHRESKKQAEEYASSLNRILREWIICDVSGVYVHKHFMSLLNVEFNRAKRLGSNEASRLFVMVFDVDDFKQVNDRFGHLAGDEVLAAFGAILNTELRSTDKVGRLGGDEFGGFGYCHEESPGAIARRIAKSFREVCYLWEGKRVHLTVSIGFSLLQSSDESPNDIIKRADTALYAVKRRGKNGLGFSDASGTAVEQFRFKKLAA